MRGRSGVAVPVLFLAVVASGFGQQRVFPSDSLQAQLVNDLLLAEGHAAMSASGPYTAAELFAELSRLNSSSGVVDALRSDVEADLLPRPIYAESERFRLFVEPALTAELAAHTLSGSGDWARTREERRPVISLPLSFDLGDGFHASMLPVIGFEPAYIEANPDKLFNVPTDFGQIDFLFPYRAYLSVGADTWTVQMGRDRLSWGNGGTGNLVLSDAADVHEFIRFAAFVRGFKYHATYVGLEHWNDGDISQMANDRRGYIAHRIEARLWDRISLALTEALVFESPNLQLRFFNPFMVFHNWFLNDHHGNIIFGIEADATVARGLAAYGQVAIDQLTSAYERERYGVDAYPQSYGILGGVRYRTQLGPGLLAVDAEYANTSPWMYIIEGQPSLTIDRRVLSNTLGSIYLITKPLGYRYGPDTMVVDLSARYRFVAGPSFRLGVHHRQTGEVSLDSPYETGPEAIAMRTPSGDSPQKHTIVRLGADVHLGDIHSSLWPFSVGTDVAFVGVRNRDNVAGADDRDVQVAIWVTFEPIR